MLYYEDKQLIDEIERELRECPEFDLLKTYIQHGSVTTYEHVRRVAETACIINRKLFASSADMETLIKGALLHDFFLYDWHTEKLSQLHGFYHPGAAYKNALRIYGIDDKVGNIILAHMWPLTLRTFPRSKEAIIVNMADKIASTRETVMMRGKMNVKWQD